MKPLLILHRDNHNDWHRLNGAVSQLAADFDILLCAADADLLPTVLADGQLMLLPVATNVSPEALCELLLPYCQQRSHIVAGADPFGRELLPRLAAQLDRPMVSEVLAIDSASQWRRPCWAGEIEQTVVGDGAPVVITIQPQGFTEVVGMATGEHQRLALAQTSARVSERRIEPSQSTRPALMEAKTVIAVGRGACSELLWPQIEALADKLGAAIGGTRPVIDAGWLASELQIGQTGHLIAPERYIGLGISGATQHMAGIKQAKIVIAVNQDSDAPLMQLADYALTGDLNKVLPELIAAL